VLANLTKPGYSVELGDDHNSNKYEWSKVNIPAGQNVMISVLDGNDAEGWSGAVSRENVPLLFFWPIFSLFRLPSSRAMTTPV